MGLDNAICVVPKTARAWNWLKSFVEETCPGIDVYETEDGIKKIYEFAYWRKCYNIRTAMLVTFKDKEYDGQGGEMYFDSEADIEDVIKVLKYFLVKENWDNFSEEYGGYYGSSIWAWHVEIRALANQIFRLREFLMALEEERDESEDPITIKDFEIYFEDSY